MSTALNQQDKPAGKGKRISHYATPVEDDCLEFIQAIEKFKAEENQPFPSWSEILMILKSLGYEKRSD